MTTFVDVSLCSSPMSVREMIGGEVALNSRVGDVMVFSFLAAKHEGAIIRSVDDEGVLCDFMLGQ